MKTLKEQIQIMTHYLNSGEVEFYDKTHDNWIKKDINSFNWIDRDYRIKEQKKTITIEKWLISYEDDIYQILTGNRDFFNKNIHPQAKVKLLESYELEL